jgi:hypothetical protein
MHIVFVHRRSCPSLKSSQPALRRPHIRYTMLQRALRLPFVRGGTWDILFTYVCDRSLPFAVAFGVMVFWAVSQYFGLFVCSGERAFCVGWRLDLDIWLTFVCSPLLLSPPARPASRARCAPPHSVCLPMKFSDSGLFHQGVFCVCLRRLFHLPLTLPPLRQTSMPAFNIKLSTKRII